VEVFPLLVRLPLIRGVARGAVEVGDDVVLRELVEAWVSERGEEEGERGRGGRGRRGTGRTGRTGRRWRGGRRWSRGKEDGGGKEESREEHERNGCVECQVRRAEEGGNGHRPWRTGSGGQWEAGSGGQWEAGNGGQVMEGTPRTDAIRDMSRTTERQ